jgi:hypothetical protein
MAIVKCRICGERAPEVTGLCVTCYTNQRKKVSNAKSKEGIMMSKEKSKLTLKRRSVAGGFWCGIIGIVSLVIFGMSYSYVSEPYTIFSITGRISDIGAEDIGYLIYWLNLPLGLVFLTTSIGLLCYRPLMYYGDCPYCGAKISLKATDYNVKCTRCDKVSVRESEWLKRIE